MRKCPITQQIVSDSGHSTKGLKKAVHTYMQGDEIQRFHLLHILCIYKNRGCTD